MANPSVILLTMPPDNSSSGDEDNSRSGREERTFFNFGFDAAGADPQRSSEDSNESTGEEPHPRLAHVVLSFRSRVPHSREKATAAALQSLTPVPIAEIPEGERDCVICYEPLEDAPATLDMAETGQKPGSQETNNNATQQSSPDTTNSNPERDPHSQQAPEPAGRPESSLPQDNLDSSTGSNSRSAAADSGSESEPRQFPMQHTAVRMPCNHIFGRSCIYSWLENNIKCPICRTPVEGEEEQDMEQQYQMLHMNLDVLLPEDDNHPNPFRFLDPWREERERASDQASEQASERSDAEDQQARAGSAGQEDQDEAEPAEAANEPAGRTRRIFSGIFERMDFFGMRNQELRQQRERNAERRQSDRDRREQEQEHSHSHSHSHDTDTDTHANAHTHVHTHTHGVPHPVFLYFEPISPTVESDEQEAPTEERSEAEPPSDSPREQRGRAPGPAAIAAALARARTANRGQANTGSLAHMYFMRNHIARRAHEANRHAAAQQAAAASRSAQRDTYRSILERMEQLSAELLRREHESSGDTSTPEPGPSVPTSSSAPSTPNAGSMDEQPSDSTAASQLRRGGPMRRQQDRPGPYSRPE